MTELGSDEAARGHLALALDVDDLVVALRMARPLHRYFSVVKIGLELFSAAGPEAVATFTNAGFEVFLDLKLHDIPTTVGRASRVLGALGVTYTTVHTCGGLAMVEAATSAMKEGASSAGLASPCVLGVTVLTSDTEAPPEELRRRAGIAVKAGCGGLVCAAADIEIVEAAAPGLLKVVPGIRPAEVGTDDQARVATPGGAILAGADLLVIGRAVTGATAPEAAAAAVRDEVASALSQIGPY